MTDPTTITRFTIGPLLNAEFDAAFDASTAHTLQFLQQVDKN